MDWILYLSACLYGISALMFTYGLFLLKKQDIRPLNNKIHLLESDIADVVQRFSRFQNRENLRKARETKDDDRDLATQAQDLLQVDPGAQVAPTRKAALRERLRTRK